MFEPKLTNQMIMVLSSLRWRTERRSLQRRKEPSDICAGFGSVTPAGGPQRRSGFVEARSTSKRRFLPDKDHLGGLLPVGPERSSNNTQLCRIPRPPPRSHLFRSSHPDHPTLKAVDLEPSQQQHAGPREVANAWVHQSWNVVQFPTLKPERWRQQTLYRLYSFTFPFLDVTE